MTQIGTARLGVQADTAPALAQLRKLAADGSKIFGGMQVAPSVNTATFKNALKTATSGMSTKVDIQVGVKPPKQSELRAAFASSTVQIMADVKVRPPKQSEVNNALKGVKAEKEVKLTVDSADAAAKIGRIRTLLNNLRDNLRTAFNFNVTALNGVVTASGNAARQLREAAASVQSLGRINPRVSGSGAGGGGGGSPSNSASAEERQAAANYRATLQLNIRLAREAAQQEAAAAREARAQEVAATRAAAVQERAAAQQRTAAERQARQDAAAAARQAAQETANLARAAAAEARRLAQEQRANQQAASAAARQAAAEQVRIDREAAANFRATQQLNIRLARERQQAEQAANRAAEQAARQAAAVQTESVARIGRQLQITNSQYATGTLSLREYLRALQQIERDGAALAPTLAAGSREALALQRALQGVGSSRTSINTQSITNLRTELARARTAYEQALSAAGNSWQGQQQAARQYQQVLARVDAQIVSISRRQTVTPAQLQQLEQLRQRMASQQNSLSGTTSPLGLSGNVLNALRQIPMLAQAAGGSLGAASGAAQQLGSTLSGAAGAAGPLGVALGALVLTLGALATALTQAFGKAATFQQTMVDIRALTGPTTAELAQLKQATADVGTPLGVGMRDAASSVLELNKAGLDAKDAVGGGLAGALTLAGAAGLDAAEGSRIAVGAMTAFGLQAKDLPTIADVFTNFANKTFLGAQDLSQGLAAVGPVAKSAGLDIKQFAGYMATLAQGGFKNMSDAGTSLKTMLLALQSPSTAATKVLSDLKLNVYDAAGKMRPLGAILDELREKTRGLSEQQRNAKLKDLFGTDAIRAVMVLMGDYNKTAAENSARIEENIKAMGLQGEAARVAKERMESYQGQSKILAATWEQLQIAAGEKLLPALTALVRGLTNLLDTIKNGGPALDDLRGKAEVLAFAIGAIALAVKRVAIQGMITDLQTAFALLGGWPGLAGRIGPAFAAAGNAIRAAFTAAGAGGLAASAILVGVVATAAALAATLNHLQTQLQETYARIDQADNDAFEGMMARIQLLRAAHTKLGDAQAAYLSKFMMLQQAQTPQVIGVNWLGERIYSSIDEARVRQLQADVIASKRHVNELTAAAQHQATTAVTGQKAVGQALQLTDDQLKKQTSTVAELTKELSKPIKLFGGTEFQQQLDQVGEKYRQLREKLYSDVKDPTKLAPLKVALSNREQAERGQVTAQYTSKANDEVHKNQLEARRAQVAAMAEGAAKIKAQAKLDADVIRQSAKDEAIAWADFPSQVKKINAAASSQVKIIQQKMGTDLAEWNKKQQDDLHKAKVSRDTLVREMGQSLVKFDSLVDNKKVTGGGLLSFTQQWQDFGAKVKELPANLRGNTAALQAQAHELSVHAAAVVRDNAALAAQKKALADSNREQALSRQLTGLISSTSRKTSAGTFSANDLEGYTNQLANIRAKAAQLPASLQAPLAPLLAQASSLKGVASAAANYNSELTKLKGSVKDMSMAELQAARNRVVGDATKTRSLALLEKEIALRQKAIDKTIQQQAAEGRKRSAQTTLDNYDTAIAGAKDHPDKVYQLEIAWAPEVLKAKAALAQEEAQADIQKIIDDAQKAIDAAGAGSAQAVQLAALRDKQIADRRAQRDATFARLRQEGEDKLTEAHKASDEYLLKLDTETAAGQAAIREATAQGIIDTYDSQVQAAQENAGQLLAIEKKSGLDILQARNALATEKAEADKRQLSADYAPRITQAGGPTSAEGARLAQELADRLVLIDSSLATTIENNNQAASKHLLELQEAYNTAVLKLENDLRDSRLQIATDDAARRKTVFEQDTQDQLDALGENEQAKYNLLVANLPSTLAFIREENRLKAQAETDSENDRFAELQKSLTKQGLWAANRERLEADHQNRLTNIAANGAAATASAIHTANKAVDDQLGKVREKDATTRVEGLLAGLDKMSRNQRDGATQTLEGWLTTFQGMGAAGAAAAKVIQEALDKVKGANLDAQQRVMEASKDLGGRDTQGRFLSTGAQQQSFERTLGKIGKPDSREDAVAKGSSAYDSVITDLKKQKEEAEKVIEELGKKGLTLNAEQQQRLDRARAFLPQFTAQLAQTEKAAGVAGQRAGEAFTRAEQMAVASANLAQAAAARDVASSDPSRAASANAAYLGALRDYRDTAKKVMEDTRVAFASGKASQEEWTKAQVEYANAEKNVAGAVLDSQKKMLAQERYSVDLRQQLAAAMGQGMVPAYQSELRALEDAKLEYPELTAQIDLAIKKYKELAAARKGIVSAQSLKLDFRIGFNGGQKQLQDSISNVAKGFGQLTSPLALFAAILDKINPVGAALESMFAVLEEPLKALQEPFAAIGELIGSVLAPALEALGPIVSAVVNVFIAVYDAIASFLKTISWGIIDIRRRKSSDAPAEKKKVADQQQQNDLDQLELEKRQKLLSDADYEARKLEITKRGLERQRQADLDAAKNNAELKEEINRKYDLAIENAHLDMLDRLKAAFTEIGDNLMSNIQSGIKDGLMGALKAGNFGSFRTSLRKNLREAMFDAVLNAAIETAAIKGILQPAINALTAAFASGNQGAIDKALNGVLKAGDQVEQKAKGIYTALKPLRDKWGITGETQDQKVEVVGNVSAPEVKISLDALGLLGNVIQVQIPPFSEALLGNTEQLKLHTPALAAHTAAIPTFVTAVAAFGVSVGVYGTAGNQIATAGNQIYAASGNILQAADRILAAADRFDSSTSGGGKYGR